MDLTVPANPAPGQSWEVLNVLPNSRHEQARSPFIVHKPLAVVENREREGHWLVTVPDEAVEGETVRVTLPGGRRVDFLVPAGAERTFNVAAPT